VESTSAIETLLAEAQTIITRLDAAVKNKSRHAPPRQTRRLEKRLPCRASAEESGGAPATRGELRKYTAARQDL
jgi:hypothetical protein